MLRKTMLLVAMLGQESVLASSEVPLSWETVELGIDQRGGIVVTASRSSEGYLDALSVSIRGASIDIPGSCFPGENIAYLNSLRVSYGEFDGGVPYWRLSIDIEYAASFNGVGAYYLVLLEDRVKLSYIERPESEAVLVDEPLLCGSWN